MPLKARVMEVVAGNRTKLPQTDAGMAVINSAITNACEYMRSVGYIAEGVWNGDEIKDLIPGDVIAGGFMVFIDSFATMLQADREARKAPDRRRNQNLGNHRALSSMSMLTYKESEE